MLMYLTCGVCAKEFAVEPYRLSTARVCSRECYAEWRSRKYVGQLSPSYKHEPDRRVTCKHCRRSFVSPNPPSVARRQKFCGKACYDAFQTQDGTSRGRGHEHDKWAERVIARDGARCQWCGDESSELHAHHIRPFINHPELRYDLSNGITLCAPCHWTTYAERGDNGVKSGNPQRKDGGNPEPSLRGNVEEGVTTRGRACRRWNGPCAWCGTHLSKRLSDVKGRKNVTCCYQHSAMVHWHGPRYGSNAPTSAPAVKARDSLSLRETVGGEV